MISMNKLLMVIGLCSLSSLFSLGDDKSVVVASEDYANSDKKNIKVYVSGEVHKPMTAVVPRKTTLKSVVEHVGGAKELAALHRVILMRKNKLWRYDLKKENHQKIKLEPFDLVFIPQKDIIGE